MNTLEVRRFGLRVGKILRSRFGKPRKTYFHHRTEQYAKIWAHASDACGARLVRLAPDLWRAERAGIHVYLRNHEIQLDDPVILTMAGRKPLVHKLLAEAGLAVPPHRVFSLRQIEPAMQFLAQHPEGVVVKPANGSAAGDGVSTHLRTPAQVRSAAVLASLYDTEILVESQVPGESYRALVVGGRMLHAVCRRGPRVTGDGRRTVRELLGAENAARKVRRQDAIQADADFRFTVNWQGFSMDGVVPEGSPVLLRTVENPEGGDREIRTVYNSAVTGLICHSIRADVERAAAVLGSDFLGVDLLMTDPGKPLAESGGSINEVNTTPALHHHYDATIEAYPPVAADVLNLAFRRRAEHGPSQLAG